MPHPHQSYLDEFKIAIDKLVPLMPDEKIKEAQDLHAELLADEDTTEKQIHQALTLVGRTEFPYRKAYIELCAGDEEKRLREIVFERLDDKVKKKVEEMTEHGVLIEDLVKSKLFEEQFDGDERLQISNAILLADDVLDKQCDERAHSRQTQYEDLVKRWTTEATRLQGLIDQLRAMAQEDKKWSGEINSICDKLEEGWSIVEKDPQEEEIIKEIEYWNTVLHEDQEEA